LAAQKKKSNRKVLEEAAYKSREQSDIEAVDEARAWQ
jgi:hypothetical protein